jgi:hypothetical protein
MIKPKYPKNADLSQIARSIVEHATGEPLVLPSPKKVSKNKNKSFGAKKNGD